MMLSPRILFRSALTCMIAGFGLIPCMAQEEEMEELSLADLFNLEVVTASRKAESRDVAPNVMYVINKEEIRKRGYKTLKDVVRTIPGFNVFHKDLWEVMQIRGIAPDNNDKVAFMINSHPIRGLWENDILVSSLALQDVERIEIIVGPGSVLYGSKTLGGIINIITQQPDNSEITAATNFADFGLVTAMTGKQFDTDKKVSGSVTWIERGGYDIDDLNLAKINQLYPVSYYANAQAELGNWGVEGSSYRQTINQGVSGKGELSKNQRIDNINSIILRNGTQITDDILLKGQFSMDDNRMNSGAQHIYGSMSINSTTGDTSYPSGGGWDFHMQQFDGEVMSQMRFDQHFIQVGLQAEYNIHDFNYWLNWHINHWEWGDANTSITQIVKRENTYIIGGFASWEWQIMDMLKTVAAIRGDYNTIIDTFGLLLNFSPRIAVIANPIEQWTAKLMFNTATRFPEHWVSPLNQQFGLHSNIGWANQNPIANIPERLYAWELQNILNPFSKLRLSLNAYYQLLRNFIAWKEPFTNVGDFKGFGVEFEGKWYVMDDLAPWVNLSFQDAEFFNEVALDAAAAFADENDDMVSVAKFGLNAGIDFTLMDIFYLMPQVRYFTKQPAFDDQDTQDWITIDNILYLDIGTGVQYSFDDAPIKDVSLNFAFRNITNNTEWIAKAARKQLFKTRGFNWDMTVKCSF